MGVVPGTGSCYAVSFVIVDEVSFDQVRPLHDDSLYTPVGVGPVRSQMYLVSNNPQLCVAVLNVYSIALAPEPSGVDYGVALDQDVVACRNVTSAWRISGAATDIDRLAIGFVNNVVTNNDVVGITWISIRRMPDDDSGTDMGGAGM